MNMIGKPRVAKDRPSNKARGTRILQASMIGWCLLVSTLSTASLAATPTSPVETQEKAVPATSVVVREIQFMLLTVGIDPGPIDGNAQQLTNRAIHMFQQRSGLPVADIVNNEPISAALLDRLRREAAQVMLKDKAGVAPPPQAPAEPPAIIANTAPPMAAPSIPAPPPAETAAIRPEPPPPQPDRFASCAYTPDDFRIGGRQYTIENFLDEGFGGSAARAVANLRQRLEEARQLAERIGGAALAEVQRQARVLNYFECRLKIEQASAGKG